MVIKSILDTDLYKFTTSYAYIKLFPYAQGTFIFKDRDETEYNEDFLNEFQAEIRRLKEVRLHDDELEYMNAHCRFLPRIYWEWLAAFRFDPEKIRLFLGRGASSAYRHHRLPVQGHAVRSPPVSDIIGDQKQIRPPRSRQSGSLQEAEN